MAHTANEWVESPSSVAAARIYARMFTRVPRRAFEVMERFDVFVIGGGGTGSEVAFSLARSSGLTVAMAERDRLGGECNFYGCVPTKVMLRSAKIAAAREGRREFGVRIPSVDVDLAGRPAARPRRDRRRSPAKARRRSRSAGISVFLQQAHLTGEHRIELEDGTELEADRVVFTTGTETAVPPIPGLADGPYWTNREAIWGPDAPPASLAVIGTGAIGIEFAQIYARFGTAVTAIEVLPQILPHEDEDAAAALVPALEEEGITLLPGITIERAAHTPPGMDDRARRSRRCSPRSSWSRPVAGRCSTDTTRCGRRRARRWGRPVLYETLRTTAPNAWAAGDATGELLFTHVGSYEAELVVKDILGAPRARDYRVVPRVTFCDPEVASVGLTERAARDAGREVHIAIRELADNERADIDGSAHGLVKLVADARSGELLGGHIVGEEAGAMIHEVVAVMAGRVPASAPSRTRSTPTPRCPRR